MPEALGKYVVIKAYMWMLTMQETCQIGGRILASLSMSIIHLSYGTVNDRTHLEFVAIRIATYMI